MAEHVCFICSTAVSFQGKLLLPKVSLVPFLLLCFRSQLLSHSITSLSSHKSAALTRGWPWLPADSLVLLGFFHPLCFSLLPFSVHILFSHPSPLSLALWSPAVKEIQILFEQRTPRSDVICKNCRICFTFKLGKAVIARKVSPHDKCSINPSWALQEFKMIRSEFLLSTFGFYLICSIFLFIFLYFLLFSFYLLSCFTVFHQLK